MLRQILFHNLVLVIQYCVGACVPLLLLPHIVRNIGVAKFGELSVALAWAGMASVVIHYGFQLTGPRRVAQFERYSESCTVLRDISVAKLILLGCTLPLVLAVFVTTTKPINIAQIVLIITFVVGAALNSTWYLQAIGNYVIASAVAIVGSILALSMGFAWVANDRPYKIIAASIALTASPFVTGLLTFIAAWWRQPRRTSPILLRNIVESLKEGWPLFVSQFVSAIYGLSGPIVLSIVSDSSEVGTYSAVERFANALVGAGLLTHVAAYPKLAALFSRNRKSYWRLLMFVVALYVAVMSCLASIIWVFRDRASGFLLGDDVPVQDGLIAFGLGWILVAVIGTVLTGYWTVSGQASKVLPLNARVLVTAFGLGVPAAAWFGGAGWMGALVVSQAIIVREACRVFRRSYKSDMIGETARAANHH